MRRHAPMSLRQRNATFGKGFADCARNYDWSSVLAVLKDNTNLVNTTRPGGRSLYTPLHQAGHGGAPERVVNAMLELGAWRTVQNARGERPVDVACIQGHIGLLRALSPNLKRNVPIGVLLKIQSHFHNVIHGRASKEVEKHRLRLPELEPLLELSDEKIWLMVPGMAGGFSYWLERDGPNAKLMSESWCRVVQGSGQRHEITSSGSRLVAEGFV
jgi:hypothetical protein